MSFATRLAILLRPVFLVKALPLVIALALSAFLTYEYNAALRQGHVMVEHSMKALAAMDRVLSLLQDAETGQRGYIITGEKAYLAPYEQARDAVAGAIGDLDALVDKNAAQHEAVTEIRTAAGRKLEELAATIVLRDGAGLPAAREAMLRDDGRAEMDRIRSLLAGMKEREHAILNDAADSVSDKNQRIILVTVIALGISLLGRLASALITLRGTFASRAARQEDA